MKILIAVLFAACQTVDHKGNCKNHNMVEQRAAQIIDNNNTNCYTQYDIEFIVFGETQE